MEDEVKIELTDAQELKDQLAMAILGSVAGVLTSAGVRKLYSKVMTARRIAAALK
jgi:hypothetical protein